MMGAENTIRCYNCNQVGNISRACPDSKMRSTGMYRFYEKGGHVKDSFRYKEKCFKCIQIGHLLFVSPKGESEGENRGRNAKEKERGKPAKHVYYCLGKMQKGGILSRQLLLLESYG